VAVVVVEASLQGTCWACLGQQLCLHRQQGRLCPPQQQGLLVKWLSLLLARQLWIVLCLLRLLWAGVLLREALAPDWVHLPRRLCLQVAGWVA
jgi:hypothetical protein